jgi:hypothetical protein
MGITNNTTQKTEVWLISTKDVETLFKTQGKNILIDSLNAHGLSIFEKPVLNSKKLSLAHFYNDVTTYEDTTCFYNSMNLTNDIIKHNIIIESIKQKINETGAESSSALFDKIFFLGEKNKHSESRIFLTRCFPNTLFSNIRAIDSNKDFKLYYYWLLAYMQSVANILNKNLNELEYNFLLHDQDVGVSNGGKQKKHFIRGKVGSFPKPTLKFKPYWLTFSNDTNWNECIKSIYLYTHDDTDAYFSFVIKEPSFFQDITDPVQHLNKFFCGWEENIKNFEEILNNMQLDQKELDFSKIDFDLPLFKIN